MEIRDTTIKAIFDNESHLPFDEQIECAANYLMANCDLNNPYHQSEILELVQRACGKRNGDGIRFLKGLRGHLWELREKYGEDIPTEFLESLDLPNEAHNTNDYWPNTQTISPASLEHNSLAFDWDMIFDSQSPATDQQVKPNSPSPAQEQAPERDSQQPADEGRLQISTGAETIGDVVTGTGEAETAGAPECLAT